ncbi:16184_t:CDS:2 [Dentiscutata erythropus]|uniref:16184_t:CDS:1 n=1 Tax=Dentiscutata erythropus TaxID=1348616 RepID=A0A9N9G6L7_9GLOM|nr:16184_t:CDS:2 [Dentiscutata erythropus]
MAIPDYMTDKNAVLQDKVEWLNGKTPDYSKANARYEAERSKIHTAGSLEDLVTNLVKNWEKEASHKKKAEEWRTIDHKVYKFSTNGGPWSTAEDMLKIGTYNALIGESEFYSASRLGFEESHDVFRNSLAAGFAWEVLEVYSGPPRVSFKWRHWGKMTGTLKCPIRNGKTLVAEPTNEVVEIFGVTVATINDKYQITSLETFYNPSDLMTQMTKNCPIAGQ